MDEVGHHINFLELLAALQCFTDKLTDTPVELRIDNTSAVSYINRLGGCKSGDLCSISLRIASWCEIRRLSLSAVFVPGVMNIQKLSSSFWGQLVPIHILHTSPPGSLGAVC